MYIYSKSPATTSHFVIACSFFFLLPALPPSRSLHTPRARASAASSSCKPQEPSPAVPCSLSTNRHLQHKYQRSRLPVGHQNASPVPGRGSEPSSGASQGHRRDAGTTTAWSAGRAAPRNHGPSYGAAPGSAGGRAGKEGRMHSQGQPSSRRFAAAHAHKVLLSATGCTTSPEAGAKLLEPRFSQRRGARASMPHLPPKWEGLIPSPSQRKLSISPASRTWKYHLRLPIPKETPKQRYSHCTGLWSTLPW